MHSDATPDQQDRPYLERSFIKGRFQERWLTRDERDKLNPRSRDCHIDLTKGTWSIKTEEGDVKGSPDPFPFGPTHWELTEKILIAAGDFVYLPSENYIYAEFYRIQRIFGKPPKKKSNYWFEAERNPAYRVKLNPARSYRIITNGNQDDRSNGSAYE